jgi:hypothetical protein
VAFLGSQERAESRNSTRWERLRSESPLRSQDCDVVCVERGIPRHHDRIDPERLREHHSVERIAMMHWKPGRVTGILAQDRHTVDFLDVEDLKPVRRRLKLA